MIMREKHLFFPWLEGTVRHATLLELLRVKLLLALDHFFQVLHLPATQLGCCNWCCEADPSQPKHVFGSGVL